MKLRQFVSGSAIVLAGWLAVTFVHHTPVQRYPRLDKQAAAKAAAEPSAPLVADSAEEFALSASR